MLKKICFFCLILGVLAPFGQVSAETTRYDIKLSNEIILKGDILFASASEDGAAHYFTVKYKKQLFLCQLLTYSNICFQQK